MQGEIIFYKIPDWTYFQAFLCVANKKIKKDSFLVSKQGMYEGSEREAYGNSNGKHMGWIKGMVVMVRRP